MAAGTAPRAARYPGSPTLIPSWPPPPRLSSVDDRTPDAQKYCQNPEIPISAARAFSMSSGCVLLTKMPAKITATEAIGPKLKRLARWMARGVIR